MNWMRLNEQPSTRPSTRTSSVLPSPGTLSIKTWPSARSDASTPRTSVRWPTKTLLTSPRTRSDQLTTPLACAGLSCRVPSSVGFAGTG